MFKDRVFNISLLISFGWHLFCVFFFVLVVTPKGFTFNNFPKVNFLGPILEANAFSSGYNLKSVFMSTPYKQDFTSDKEAFIQGQDYLDSQVQRNDRFGRADFVEPGLEKQVPEIAGSQPLENSGQQADKNIKLPNGLSIEGPLSGRELIYKPEFPRLPDWAMDKAPVFSIDFDVLVSGAGMVSRISQLTTTGYPEIDSQFVSYARSFIFSQQAGPQQGRMHIVAELKNDKD